MKENIVMLGVLAAMTCAVAPADSRNFYFAPNPMVGAGIAVTNKAGGRALVAWAVQPIANESNAGYPPTTNAPDYIDTANGEQYYNGADANQTNIMGYSNVDGSGLVGDGEGSWATSKLGAGYGYIRFFSATTVTGAAYYGESARYPLTAGGDPDIIDNAVIISNVNPAYNIPFATPPQTNAGGLITGRVVCGPGYNELTANILRIAARPLPAGTWLQEVTPDAAGNFSFAPASGAGDFEVRAIAADGTTPRDSLPFSATYTVTGVLPEPAALALLLALGSFRLKSVRCKV